MKSSAISFSEMFKIMIDRRKLTAKKAANLYKNVYYAFRRRTRLESYPSWILIDPSTNICNLRCPHCVESKKSLTVPRTILKKENFFRLIDEVSPYTMGMSLYYTGEPLLNNDLFEMVRYGHNKNMYFITSSNLNIKMTDEYVHNMINSGLDALIVAVSGYTNEVYRRQHIGGDIELVKENIEKVQRYKERTKSKYPKIVIRYLLAKYNKEEKGNFYDFAAKNKVDYFETSLMNFINKDDQESLHQKKETSSHNHTCWWPWLSLAVHSEGTTEPCCYYSYNVPKLGNIFALDTTVSDIWNSVLMNDFRRNMVVSGKNGIECCQKCMGQIGYQRRLVSGK